jgi:hypothetical protein
MDGRGRIAMGLATLALAAGGATACGGDDVEREAEDAQQQVEEAGEDAQREGEQLGEDARREGEELKEDAER